MCLTQVMDWNTHQGRMHKHNARLGATFRKRSATGVTLGMSKTGSSASEAAPSLVRVSHSSCHGAGSCTTSLLLRGVSALERSSEDLFAGHLGVLGVSGTPDARPCNDNNITNNHNAFQPGLGACGASLSSPGRTVLSNLIGARIGQMMNVRHDHIVPDFSRLANMACACLLLLDWFIW